MRTCIVVGLVLTTACAHRNSTQFKGATLAATAQQAEADELRAQLAERDRRINQLESRVALVEAEQRQHRLTLEDMRSAPIDARESVRIGSPADPHEGETSEGLAPVREPKPRRDPRPVLRLYEEGAPSYAASDMSAPAEPRAREAQPLMPIPQVSERLPRFVPEAGGAAPLGAPEHYRQALDLVRQRNFDAALISLNDFLVRYENDARAPRVLFWRGEVLFAQHDYARALAAFETSLVKDPGGEKAADAWLRIARCHKRLGAKDRAREALERLKSQFPNSEAARLATQEDA